MSIMLFCLSATMPAALEFGLSRTPGVLAGENKAISECKEVTATISAKTDTGLSSDTYHINTIIRFFNNKLSTNNN